ncbi:MAG TPA: UrcA family protein [Woeseiaceae bacterium]|nr:UrcA family protein [Woeseiaceae bacterium]
MNVSRRKRARVDRHGRARLCASLAGAVLVIGSGAVQAEQPSDVRTATVRYADLNLATEAGVETLYHRIRVAARTVCGSPYERQITVRRSIRECHEAAIEDAVASVEQRAQLPQLRAQLESAGRGTSN